MLGTIIKGIAGFYYVKVNEDVIECKARGKFRFDELTPIVGDKVEISVKDNKGVVEKILPRISQLIRPMVSNVTQSFVVFSLRNPDINLDLLNRFLLHSEYNSLHTIVCLNKIDLVDEKDYGEVTQFINNLGYEIILINAKEGKGIDKLFSKLPQNVTVLCGPSGAGKSTLLNKLCGKELMETGEISERVGRGKHTTRHSQLIEVNQGFIVDTPGFSNMEVDTIKNEALPYCFPEFKEYNTKCKFTGCLHFKEPGCAVKIALENNKINKIRYDFYIKILNEISNRRNKKW